MDSKFPSNKFEALAYLYVQKSDLSEKSPADIFEAYQNAYKQIKETATQYSKQSDWKY